MPRWPTRPPALLFVAGLGLAALACGSVGIEPTATPFARPTQTPAATPTEAVEVEPTSPPRPTATDVSQVAFAIADEAYEHPSGAFAIRLPEDWELEEFDSSVSASDPSGVGFIEVAFVNVGLEFSAAELEAYALAVEENWFATFDQYEPDAPEVFESGTLLIFKTLEFDGIPQTIYSYYWQEGTVVYTEDFWVDSDQYDDYVDAYGDISSSTLTDAEAGAEADLYALRYEFVAPGELFAFNVPYGWAHTTSTDDVATLDSFNAPDDVTSIETIVYDDGTDISASLAGDFALTLLREFYDFSDVRVSADETLADGREKLTWTSADSEVDGVSYFEARGTTFSMFSWIVEQTATDFYLPFWESTADSYYVP